MFEVEQGLNLTEEEVARLLVGAKSMDQEIIHDVYWDTPDFSLTTKDWR